jgi:hypothetical protein
MRKEMASNHAASTISRNVGPHVRTGDKKVRSKTSYQEDAEEF